MDGLVLDTESTYCLAWQQAAAAMNYPFSEAFCASVSGLHGDAVAQQLLALYGADFDLTLFNRLCADFWQDHVSVNGIAIKAGFTELLDFIAAHELPYCLATNSRAVNARHCLELAGLSGVFTTLISRDDVAHGKPDPAIFLTAAARLHVNIKQCLVLEDSHSGIVAAAKAEAFSVYVPSVLPVDPLTITLCNVMKDDLTAVLATMQTHC